MRQKTILAEKVRESLSSVLPVSLIVLALALTICPLPNSVFLSFLFGAFLMVFGMGLFTLGVDLSMTPMGEYVGTNMTRSRKIWLICLLSFLVGTMITVSEPDLQVLAANVPSIDTTTFILTVAIGVGIFLVLAILRSVFAVKLRHLLFVSYGIIFLLAAFVSPDFWAVAFDAGGVTTGPMTVPFIMAMGVGIAAITAEKAGGSDSFGLMALCSAGPIIAILILGLIYRVSAGDYVPEALASFETSRGFGLHFLSAVPGQMLEVAKGLLPIVIFFFLYQAITRPLGKESIYKLLIGVAYTYAGIVLFLTGVNTGFLPVGRYIGETLGAASYAWLLIPLGMLLGYFIVAAEPAVHVLEKQVEDATDGAIPSKMLKTAISIGVALAVGIAMLRVLTGISVMWFVGVGYALSLSLSFFVPEVFTSIAFDSGGVASGAMSSAFLMPLAVGASYARGGNIMTDAFGVIAMVAMFPPITIQVLGVVYRFKRAASAETAMEADTAPIDFPEPIPAAQTEAFPVQTPAGGAPAVEYPDIIEFDLTNF